MFNYCLLLVICSFSCTISCLESGVHSFGRDPGFGGPNPFGRGPPFIGQNQFQPRLTKPTKALGSSCEESAECLTAYASCADSVCRCREGFQPDTESRCAPKKVSCPVGEPLTSGIGQRTKCTIGFKKQLGFGPGPGGSPLAGFPFSGFPEDSCPDNYFCLSEGGRFQANQVGHCCPLPEAVCPVGEPDKRYTCSPLLRGSPFPPPGFEGNFGNPFQPQPDTTDAKPRCPSPSHYCHSFGGGWGPRLRNTMVCCPRACLFNSILKDGVCYGMARIGENCQIEEQCVTSQGTCEEGKCSCGKDKIPNPSGNFCQSPYCPYNRPVQLQQKPPLASRKEDGSFLRCHQDQDCGTKQICMQRSFCCPEPEPYCPNESEPIGTNMKFCDPAVRNPFVGRRNQSNGPVANEQTCEDGQYCFGYFAGFSQGRKGVCCERGRLQFTTRNFGPVNTSFFNSRAPQNRRHEG